MGSCSSKTPKKTPQRGGGRNGEKAAIGENGRKIVLLGEMSTGKTCLVLRLVKNEFSEKELPTIGAAFMVHKMNVDDKTVKLEIWDTAGQERFRSLAPMYYKGAAAAVIVYDITKPESFDTLIRWVEELKVRAPPNIVIALAGNKCDLESERAITVEQAEQYLQKIEEGGGERPIFFECSAKSGQGVQELFKEICRKLEARQAQ